MVAFPMFDAVMACAITPEQSSRVAARLVSSALAEIDQIQKLDESLAPQEPLQFDRRTAALVRGMYEKWAQETELLLNRLEAIERRFGRIPEAQNLRDAHGRTMAMLSTSLEDLEQGVRDVAEGRTHSINEVRRELHLRPR
jgi:hypothetical protein